MADYIDIEASPLDPATNTRMLTIRVDISRELLADLDGNGARAKHHSLVDWIAKELHAFVDRSFDSSRVLNGTAPSPVKSLKGASRG